MTRPLAHYLILNTFGLGALTIAALNGWVARMFLADASYLCVVIALAFTAANVCVLFAREWAAWLGQQLVLLGLIGTVLGFVLALGGIDASSAGDLNAVGRMIGALVQGMGTALWTTLAGAIGFLWIDLLLRVTR